MISNDSDYEADEVPRDLIEDLEQLALALDAQRCPGPAWSLAPAPRPQPRNNRQVTSAFAIRNALVATGIAAACIAIAAIVVHHSPEPQAGPPSTAADLEPPLAAVRDAEPRVSGPQPGETPAVAFNAPPRNDPAIPGDDVAKSDGPQIVVVEDLDSYSVIDISGRVPVVSYMSKDSPGAECPVAVPFASAPPPDKSAGIL